VLEHAGSIIPDGVTATRTTSPLIVPCLPYNSVVLMQQPVLVAPGLADSGRAKATAPAPDPIGFSPVRCPGGRPGPPVSSFTSKGGGDGASSTSTAPTDCDDEDEDVDNLDGGRSRATNLVMKVGDCHVTCLTPPELVSATTADSFDFSVVGWGGASNGSGPSSAHHGPGGQRGSDPWPPQPRRGPEKSHALVSELAFAWITPTQRAVSAARSQQQNQKQKQKQLLPRPWSQKRQGPKPRSDPHFLRKAIDEALLSSPTPVRGRSGAVTVNSLGDAPWKHPISSEAPTVLRPLPIDAPIAQVPSSAQQGRLRSRTTSPPPASPAPTSSLLRSANRGLSRSASNLVMDGTSASFKHSRATASSKRSGPSSVGDARAKDARPHKSVSSGRGRDRSIADEPKVDAACHHHHHARSHSVGRFQATRRQEPEGFAARDAEAYPSTPTPQPWQQRSFSFALAGSSPNVGATFSSCETHAWSDIPPFSPRFCGADDPLDLVAAPPPPPPLRRTGSEAAREVGLTDEQLQRLREAGFRITPRESS
jgi:hypothetical protein